MLGHRRAFAAPLLATILLGTGAPARILAAEGSLARNVEEILAAGSRSACEERDGARMLEIARALDERAVAIRHFEESKPREADGATRLVPLGPAFVRERLRPAPPGKGWATTDESSWSDIAAQYERAKKKPAGEEWLALNNYVRGTLVDDSARVLSGRNFFLYPNMAAIHRSVRASLSRCWADARCDRLSLPVSESAFLSGQPAYQTYVNAMAAEADGMKRRSILAALSFAMKMDSRVFSFRPNESVRQAAPGAFEVSVDAGPFAAVSKQIAAYVEEVWRAPGKSVKLRFASRADYPEIYLLQLGEGIGGRAFVSPLAREMTVFSGVRARSLAHEFGHVLGFPDAYFTIWDPKECRYRTLTRMDSLMGDSEGGLVLPEHWAELEKQYPLK